MKAVRFALVSLLFSASIFAADSGSRFSQSLTPAERTEMGLTRLDSDQIAVLDAMFRRHAAATARSEADGAPPLPFSQRLTADERRNAGLLVLTAAEVARVDQLVERIASAIRTRALLAPPVYVARARPVEPRENNPERKIHGTLSLSMGWGSGGYSERTGSMVLRMDDPAGRYSITVGYSESHVKNGSGYIQREAP